MGIYIAKRLLTMIPLWILLSIITFFLIELPPGDVVSNEVIALRAQNLEVDESMIARMRAQWGLDDAFHVRYLRWVENIIARGDLGSTVDGRENHRCFAGNPALYRHNRRSALWSCRWA